MEYATSVRVGPRNSLLLTAIIVGCLLGPGRSQRIRYCAGDGQAAVIFRTDNTGTITDGAVDTGMGVYKPHTDCKWVIKPIINEQVFRTPKANLRREVLSPITPWCCAFDADLALTSPPPASQLDPVNHRVVLHFEYLNIEAGFDFLTVISALLTLVAYLWVSGCISLIHLPCTGGFPNKRGR